MLRWPPLFPPWEVDRDFEIAVILLHLGLDVPPGELGFLNMRLVKVEKFLAFVQPFIFAKKSSHVKSQWTPAISSRVPVFEFCAVSRVNLLFYFEGQTGPF